MTTEVLAVASGSLSGGPTVPWAGVGFAVTAVLVLAVAVATVRRGRRRKK